jgi:NDP-sugar pyrophosphorylase family protein
MLAVRGKPLLEHQLLWLKGQGFSEITLCLGHKADVVRGHFGDGTKWGVRLTYSVEKQPRGTAGCVLDLKTKDDLLIVYGDLYIETELASLLDIHARHPEFAATLGLIRSDHPQDSDLARVEGDRIVEIYRGGDGSLALAAVWLVRSDILKLIPADRPSDFGRDIFPAALAAGTPLGGCVMTGLLADLGTPERLARFA